MSTFTQIPQAAVLAALLAAPVLAQDAPAADTVVATVNGHEITLGQMIIARSQLPPQYQQLPEDVLFDGVLDQMIQQQVFADTLAATPARVTIALQNERRALLAGEAVNALMQSVVTDAALQEAYDGIFGDATAMIEWNAAHLLVATEDEANAARARIMNGGEDFATVAQDVSSDVGSGANGGNLGWFGPGMMVAPFEAAVAEMTVGEVSAPVESQFGWHVIQLLDSREQEPPSLDEVRDALAGQVQQQAIEARLVELMEAAEITMPEEGAFDPAILGNLDLLSD